MSLPIVSIVMPVYNADVYLPLAIESILNQTFSAFEFLIIDDGSTDSSPEIISNYANHDPRIKYVSHENRGIGAALNEGVSLACGKYIARMDADDISEAIRLEEQVGYLDKHPECTALFTEVRMVNEKGEPIEDWLPDRDNISPQEIRRFMPLENCCAHPSLMIRAKVMKRYMYDESQVPSEDYDLWLRLLSDGEELHKLDQRLLSYRLHDNSISQTSNRLGSPQKKYLKSKSRFLYKQIKGAHFGSLEMRVLNSLLATLISILWKELGAYRTILLRYVRRSYYLVQLRYRRNQLGASQRFSENGYPTKNILLVIPWMTMGGAEIVALSIIEGLAAKGNRIYCISTVPAKNGWRDRFRERCVDTVEADKLYKPDEIPQFIVDYSVQNNINTVITTNNAAGYLAAEGLRMVKPGIKIFDIVHGQGGKFEKGGWPLHSTPFDKLIDKRIVVTNYMKHYLVKNYSISTNRIAVIHNGIEKPRPIDHPVPREMKNLKDTFVVLWAGRMNEEKHPELAVDIAKIVFENNQSVHFVLAGDGGKKNEVLNRISKYDIGMAVTVTHRPYDDYEPYMSASDLLLMTSEMEGLPMTILEAMSMGLPVVAPRVGGIPEMIDDAKSGYLIDYSDGFAKRAADKIEYLSQHANLCRKMGRNGRERVERDFSLETMVERYEKVIS